MQVATEKPNHLIKSELVLKQVATDLKAFISSSTDPKKKLKVVANKTGIHVRTLDRITKLENKPTYTTVFKIYRCLTESNTYSEVCERAPQIIREFLQEGLKNTHQDDYYHKLNYSEEICRNPVFAEIYLLCSTGILTREEIITRFGEYGLKLANEMVGKKVLKNPSPFQFMIGDLHIALNPESLLTLGLIAAKNYAKPENGDVLDQHFMTFLAEGVSKEAYKQLMRIDYESYQRKLMILKDPANLGTEKFFTFTITDTLTKTTEDLKIDATLKQEKFQ